MNTELKQLIKKYNLEKDVIDKAKFCLNSYIEDQHDEFQEWMARIKSDESIFIDDFNGVKFLIHHFSYKIEWERDDIWKYDEHDFITACIDVHRKEDDLELCCYYCEYTMDGVCCDDSLEIY